MPRPIDHLTETFAELSWLTDAIDIPAVTSMYTADGVLSVTSGEHKSGELVGSDQIAAFIRGATEGVREQRRHVLTNIRVLNASERTIAGTGYLTLIATENGVARVQCSGVHNLTLEQDASGTWKIKYNELILDSPARANGVGVQQGLEHVASARV